MKLDIGINFGNIINHNPAQIILFLQYELQNLSLKIAAK